MQCCVASHEPQVRPPVPQLKSSEVPATQFEKKSQHPLQLLVLQGVHTPLMQCWLVGHSAQTTPCVPHWPSLSPETQTLTGPSSQQPAQTPQGEGATQAPLTQWSPFGQPWQPLPFCPHSESLWEGLSTHPMPLQQPLQVVESQPADCSQPPLMH
jgi:hypothetical protein